jgi:hypothetical protein
MGKGSCSQEQNNPESGVASDLEPALAGWVPELEAKSMDLDLRKAHLFVLLQKHRMHT